MSNIMQKLTDNNIKKKLDEFCNLYYINEVSNPSLTLFSSMVYGFAKHLPYSMDIEQPEYVPADFFNMEPNDVDENSWFKWNDKRTFFNSMIKWTDTFRSGMLLQICFVMQKMLLGEFPHDLNITEENYTGWGIDVMTSDEEYNRFFFETLKSLPEQYNHITGSSNNEKRRQALKDCYNQMMYRIGARVGGFRETDSNGNIVREEKPSILLSPNRDVELRIYWDCKTFYDGLELKKIIDPIKKAQQQRYKRPSSNQLEDQIGLNRIAEGVMKSPRPAEQEQLKES